MEKREKLIGATVTRTVVSPQARKKPVGPWSQWNILSPASHSQSCTTSTGITNFFSRRLNFFFFVILITCNSNCPLLPHKELFYLRRSDSQSTPEPRHDRYSINLSRNKYRGKFVLVSCWEGKLCYFKQV